MAAARLAPSADLGGRRGAASGVERAEQPAPTDHLGPWLAPRGDHRGRPGAPRAQARERPFLLDQEGRVKLAGRVIEGHDQVERRPVAEPRVGRPILKQHHARQRPPRPLLAVRRALRRPLDQARVLQDALGPAVAQLEPVLGPQPLVEVLDGEVKVTRPVLLQQPLDPIDRHPPARDPAAPPIDQAFRPLGLVAIAQPPKVPLAHSQHFGCLATAQRPTPPPTDRLDDPSHPNLRQHATSPILPNRTDRELRNPDIPRATNKAGAEACTAPGRPLWWPAHEGSRRRLRGPHADDPWNLIRLAAA